MLPAAPATSPAVPCPASRPRRGAKSSFAMRHSRWSKPAALARSTTVFLTASNGCAASRSCIPPGGSKRTAAVFGLFRSGRHLARLVRIGLTLARHDALFPLDPIAGAAPFLRITRLFRRRDAAAGRRPGERLAAALTELGPSFIKLGQILSTRADLLGDEITEDLAQLQDRLPPFPAAQARALIEQEFERPLGALFTAFEDTAIAAASIPPVHFAGTAGGQVPAVELLRTGITRAMARGVGRIRCLARLAASAAPDCGHLT